MEKKIKKQGNNLLIWGKRFQNFKTFERVISTTIIIISKWF